MSNWMTSAGSGRREQTVGAEQLQEGIAFFRTAAAGPQAPRRRTRSRPVMTAGFERFWQRTDSDERPPHDEH